MPSPFPGMDPYLENPRRFPGFHKAFIVYMRELLQPRLPENYYADIDQRVWMDFSERWVIPDLEILRRKSAAAERNGGVAVARPRVISSGRVLVRVMNDPCEEVYVEVFVGEGDSPRLITHIELLSPTNKTRGEHGRQEYLQKQREILASKVHLVEIDFLRKGKHATAVPLDQLRHEVAHYDYHVCIRRYDRLGDYLVYPIKLEEPLPEIEIPLLPEDTPVTIDLQAVMNRCYEAAMYQRVLDYSALPTQPPLTPKQTRWAKKLLKERGMLAKKSQ